MTVVDEGISANDRLRPLREAFRTVLVHVQPDPAAQPRLTSAAALARMLDATLFGVGAEIVDPVYVFNDDALRDMQSEVKANLRAAEEAFRRSASDLRTEWMALVDKPVPTVARLSRSTDLIVAGGSPTSGQGGYQWCDPAELVVSSGRPVLVVPPSGGRLAAEAVVVAWKDTREARRAIADAMPFLRAAREVMVVEVAEHSENSDFGNAQGHVYEVVVALKRHGIAARAHVVIGEPDAVARELNTAAAALGADLIVAGGYGHSRLGEWAFGGVTRDLLRKPERFLLLSH